MLELKLDVGDKISLLVEGDKEWHDCTFMGLFMAESIVIKDYLGKTYVIRDWKEIQIKDKVKHD